MLCDMILLSMLCAFLVLGAIGYVREKRIWNHGVCCECKKGFYKMFDRDSQGGRLYKCTKCGNYISISWPWIDKDKVSPQKRTKK